MRIKENLKNDFNKSSSNIINKAEIVKNNENNFKYNKNISHTLFYNSNPKLKEIFLNPVSPARITGLKVRLAGRLTTERIKPKKTVQEFNLGTFDKKLINVIIWEILFESKIKILFLV